MNKMRRSINLDRMFNIGHFSPFPSRARPPAAGGRLFLRIVT
jgi:hypothetical protein